MLASDLQNTEFVGATNPDSLLNVRFFEDAIKNEFRTQQEGRVIYDNIIMIEIIAPGGGNNVIHRPATTTDKAKWPQQWAIFSASHGSGEQTSGTPLSQWPLLNKANVEMLRAIKFTNIEQIAGASDEQLQHIGMHGGMSPYALRDKAKAFLNVAKNAKYADEAAEALKKSQAEVDELKRQMAEQVSMMAEQNRELLANMEALRKQIETSEKPKRKYTRRAKEDQVAA